MRAYIINKAFCDLFSCNWDVFLLDFV